MDVKTLNPEKIDNETLDSILKEIVEVKKRLDDAGEIDPECDDYKKYHDLYVALRLVPPDRWIDYHKYLTSKFEESDEGYCK